MVDFLDIAPVARTVRIGGSDVAVPGISAEGIGSLYQRFPDVVKKLMDGPITIDLIMQAGPKPLSAILAAGLGYPGNEQAEDKASKLPVRSQADIIGAIWTASLGEDAVDFLGRLAQHISKLGDRVDQLRSEAASTADSKPSQTSSPNPSTS